MTVVMPADVHVTTRGTVDPISEADVIASARRAALDALARHDDPEPPEERVRIAVRHVFREAIGFKPVTLVTLVDREGS